MKTRFRNGAFLFAAVALLASAATSAQTDRDRVTQFTSGDGTQVTVVSGQPPARSYGPKPPFAQLDTDHDGSISRNEAAAFPPLLNDFDNLAHHVATIGRSRYERWVYR